METLFGQRRIRYLDERTIKRLIAKSDNPLLLEVIYFFGLRRSEAGLIRREDVQKDAIFIHALKRRGDYGQWQPLEGELRNRVHTHLASHKSTFLFPGYKNQGITGNAIGTMWRKVCKDAGVHCLRHSRAMRFAEGFGSMEDCQYHLRQAVIQSTAVYYKIPAQRARRTARAMVQSMYSTKKGVV